jgi:hypothetical protein
MSAVCSPLLQAQLAELEAEYNRGGNPVVLTPVEDGSFVVKVPQVRSSGAISLRKAGLFLDR